MAIRLKNYPDGNQYIRTESGMWVRNFTNFNVPPRDLNSTYKSDDLFLFLRNEIQNSAGRHTWLENENFRHEKVVIVGDGFGFREKHRVLESLPRDFAIIGVLGAMTKWELPGRQMDYYLINNPYKESTKYLSRRMRHMPKCIASLKTDHNFIANYRGSVFKYMPVYEESYSSRFSKECELFVDDYRNPMCAAIQISHFLGASKIVLLCCDDSFEGERPGSERLPNGLYQYPQHNVAHQLIDAKMFWLRNLRYEEIQTFYHSSGPTFEHATYIDLEKIASI